ncbi:MAG: metallophosphatase family protein [Gemmatimonadota bacterium]|nr:metallophosphatase family protein [Gemmatimonadota bacterium]MDH5758454.1 metallophosphatase family protein [Gemmatimonadota bacterium]
MRTIGVISDTHGLLRQEALDALAGSDLILHAGDVGDARILDMLGRIAPVHAVYGNTDWGDLRSHLPGTTVVDLGRPDGTPSGDAVPVGPLAYVTHDLDDLDLDPAAAGLSLVVTGHTHRAHAETRDGVLYLNPGSAGPIRGKLPVTVARLALGPESELEVEVVRLEV